jgi:hypothetical protein
MVYVKLDTTTTGYKDLGIYHKSTCFVNVTQQDTQKKTS